MAHLFRKPFPWMLFSLCFAVFFLYDITRNRKNNIIIAGKSHKTSTEEPEIDETIPDVPVDDVTTTSLPDSPENPDHSSLQVDFREHKSLSVIEDNPFYEILIRTADNNTIFVNFVDFDYIDFIYNFYMRTIMEFDIKNHLFISLDSKTCPSLEQSPLGRRVNCFTYANDEDSELKYSFNTKRSMYFRARIMLQMLEFGLTVLHAEVDTVFMKDPMELMKVKADRRKCDVILSADEGGYNPAVSYVRPTDDVIRLYYRVVTMIEREPTYKQAYTSAVHSIAEERQVRVCTLSPDLVVTSRDYFRGQQCSRQNKRVFGVINTDQNIALKRMRFRDCQLWSYDPNGYYSNPKGRYLMLTTSVDLKKMHRALLNLFLVSSVLNRTAILPQFFTHNPNEMQLSWGLGVWTMDFEVLTRTTSKFGFRESRFLDNNLVPESIKSSLSQPYVLSDQDVTSRQDDIIRIQVTESHADVVKDLQTVVGLDRHSVVLMRPYLKTLDWALYEKYLGEELCQLLKNFGRYLDAKSDLIRL